MAYFRDTCVASTFSRGQKWCDSRRDCTRLAKARRESVPQTGGPNCGDARSGTPPRVNGRDSRRDGTIFATPATDTAISPIVHRLQR